MSKDVSKNEISEWFRCLQIDICKSLEVLDGKAKFIEDAWEREEGGGGFSRIISNGHLIEKGGVNYSKVFGNSTQNINDLLDTKEEEFFATGVSIVLHPHNPWVPIIHMNIRYFEMSDKVWWFGGGIDLTPHYIVEESVKSFHRQLKDVCVRHSTDYYKKFKIWADKYFFNQHRKESRGVGGIFFDRLSAKQDFTKQQRWEFVKDVGSSFIDIYSNAVSGMRDKEWDEVDKKWQLIRRGRYVEFNLVYDKGTKFGLESGGRIESILMSLPNTAAWEYSHLPQNILQQQTLEKLQTNIEWI